MATLLLDLLTIEEERVDEITAQHRFDIGLLTERVVGAVEWLLRNARTRDLPVGVFDASTGAAAALRAAAHVPERVVAVVSRGGRPDLAGGSLPRVHVPTLLIVGGADPEVLALNRDAARRMRRVRDLVVVAGATHLFEEPGALDQVSRLAGDWFARHLRPRT